MRKLDPDAIARLNDPNQGLSYRAAHHGQRKYDCDTGRPYITRSEPAALTIYGERAETVMAIIEHCADVAAALTPTSGEEMRLREENERLRHGLENIIGAYERNSPKAEDEWEDGYEDALKECARIARAALTEGADRHD